MLSFNDIKKGAQLLLDGQPYQVIERHHLKKAQRRPVIQTKLRNIITGAITEHTFHQSDTAKEAEVEKMPVVFIYRHRDQAVFSQKDGRSKRFGLEAQKLGRALNYLKPNLEVTALQFEGKVVNIDLPIKVVLKVIEAPPGLKGDSAQSPTKQVKVETGYQLAVPIFVEQGDLIEINTETGQYVRRVQE